MAMEIDHKMGTKNMNAVYLSSFFGNGEETGHRCSYSCRVEHIWGNLYRCVSTGITHVCDKNCKQKILYDNVSSICRVSGQIFLLTAAEQQAIRGVRRKRELDSYDSCSFKRRCESVRSPSCFESSFQMVVPSPCQFGCGQGLMDMN
ncbi:hypothetical protein O6H91_11G006700 [Diphasiastrum complanatum]|uniref:Uncharacterized protein n=1 Tax=Diphasiastrum complanatum TaxID=34168 RepID=A0ACC2C644_DIPCM|nr:hypothetical protein O6H91_11G006700 [Diphasiastrum complanatum]